MSLATRKLAFCICEDKDADQLRGNREADQRLCLRYTDSTIPLLSKSEISSLQPSSVALQPSLCRTWSETPKTGFLTTGLVYKQLKPWTDSEGLVRKFKFARGMRCRDFSDLIYQLKSHRIPHVNKSIWTGIRTKANTTPKAISKSGCRLKISIHAY